jgi:hypothetical protein
MYKGNFTVPIDRMVFGRGTYSLILAVNCCGRLRGVAGALHT